jgi:hypothetical protein
MPDARAAADPFAVFVAAAANSAIVEARYRVVDAAALTFNRIADHAQASGWIERDERLLALALLGRLAAQLAAGIVLAVRAEIPYAAGALLRQVVEVEYLMLLGCADPSELARWYRATPEQLRKEFTPRKMRLASDGLFLDEEYWTHCELGGHPHPRARALLAEYQNPVLPTDVLLPDTVQHIRRLWTSTRLLLPQLPGGKELLDSSGDDLTVRISAWTAIEHPLVVSFDGIARSAIGGSE